ncbi:hypothetical protein [Thiomonas sp.]
MGGVSASQAEQQKLAAIEMQNSAVLLKTQWQWAQMANDLASTASPAYATSTAYRFTLANSSAFVKMIRVWIRGLQIDNASAGTAGTPNRNGFFNLLGQFTVRLGNHIYSVPSGAIPLLWQTFSRNGRLADYRGRQSFGYSSTLSNFPTTVAVSSNATYTGYVDVPLALLEKVGDADGVAPTLSNTGLQVSFTTPDALQGADALLYPFQTGGTLTVDGTNSGAITVWALIARQITVSDTGSLPPFVVGPAFIFEDVPLTFQQATTFYPFQGQQANLVLLKSILVIDSPGELAGEFSDPKNLQDISLMYDANTPVVESREAENPNIGTVGPTNFLVDQGKAIGDQPPGVYVFDFSRGTNADYPNSTEYADLQKFSRMGVRLKYAVAPQAGAQLHLLNVYLRPNFYEATVS